MADKIPIRGGFNGGSLTGLAQFASGDTLGVAHGGTGVVTIGSNALVTGNGTSAMTSESNLTFDGTILKSTGDLCATVKVVAPALCIGSEYVLPTADGSAGQLMCTDGSGALAFATAASSGADPTSTNTWTADQTFNDNVKVTLGTGGDADIYFDGTDTIINSQVVGTGNLVVRAGATSSATPNVKGMLLEDSAGVAFTIGTGNTSEGMIHFADNGAGNSGRIIYAHNEDDMYFSTAATERMRLHSDGLLRVIGTAASPTSANGAAGVAYFTGAASDSGIALGSYTVSPWNNWLQSQQENGTISAIIMQPRGGNVGIGTTSGTALYPLTLYTPNDSFQFMMQNTHATTGHGQYLWMSANVSNDSNALLYAGTGSTLRAVIYSSGNIKNANNSYGSTSDIKLKQDITDARSYWDDFKAVRFRKYRLKSDVEEDANAPSMLGVVAQEIETVFPGLVYSSTDTEKREVPVLDEDGNATFTTDDDGNEIAAIEEKMVDIGTTTKNAKYSILSQIGLKVVQELQTRLEAAEAEITILKG